MHHAAFRSAEDRRLSSPIAWTGNDQTYIQDLSRLRSTHGLRFKNINYGKISGLRKNSVLVNSRFRSHFLNSYFDFQEKVKNRKQAILLIIFVNRFHSFLFPQQRKPCLDLHRCLHQANVDTIHSRKRRATISQLSTICSEAETIATRSIRRDRSMDLRS